MSLRLTIHIDGGSRGNPGPAAYGFVISRDNQTQLEESGFLGTATNNVAEYTALVKSLRKAAELGAKEVLIRSDSELLVRQMRGEYKVKNEKLRPLWNEANQLSERFQSVRFTHVPREQNRDADRLCNEALDRSTPSGTKRPSPKSEPAAPASERLETAKELAEALLQAAGRKWIDQGRLDPTAGDVVEKILQLLDERGLVKSS